jgi:5-hydroxyisourate hydrolase-like protein (transthyretin family)
MIGGGRGSIGAKRLFLLSVIAAALVAAAAPHQAVAGEFTINACQADAGDFASVAFEDFATRGMRWRRACKPTGPGLRGLVTANVIRSGRVPDGAQSAFVLSAPPGTAISRLRWSGRAQRRDCRYALQLFAERPDGSAATIKNVRANRNCPRPEGAQASSWPHLRAYDLGGATRIVQRVVCVGAPSAQFCSSRGLNYLQTIAAEATVVDTSPPSAAIIPDSPLARGEWVSGRQAVGYEVSDNVGVKVVTAYLAGVSDAPDLRDCDYAQTIPCPNGGGRLNEVDTQRRPEGSQPLYVAAQDAAGNSANSQTIMAKLDNTAPGAVRVGLEGDETWRNRNDYDVAWENPAEPDRAPITKAHYRICRPGSGECVAGSNAGSSIARADNLSVPSPGEWDLRLWREDAAGNQQPDNASLPVKLRFDPEPPKLRFESSSTEDPTRFSVLVTDPISGLGGGGIEISRSSSGVWQALPTTQESSRLVTRIDDASLPPGDYELRATAHDQAGNLASTDRGLDGKPMRVRLPLRVASSMRAGAVRKRIVRRTVRRGGEPHKVRRTVTVLEPRAKVRFGRRVRFAGQLLDRAGNPVGGAPIQIYSRQPEGDEHLVNTATTNSHGRFAFAAEARTSQRLRFAYAGTSTRLPVDDRVALLVSGSSTFEVSRSRILNGQSVLFSGRVRGRPLPEAGKLIELQVRLSDEWSTFQTIRSSSDGRWRIPYRFERACGVQRFRFRARLPGEASYPLESGHSRQLTIRVRGRPCFTG